MDHGWSIWSDITFRWSVRNYVHLGSICGGDSQSPTKNSNETQST